MSPEVNISATYYNSYTVLKDIECARWLRTYHSSSFQMCADKIARYHVLNSYGEFPREGRTLPSCYVCSNCSYGNMYVFISEFNNLRGVVQEEVDSPSHMLQTSEIMPKLIVMNRIYSNGGAVIYQWNSRITLEFKIEGENKWITLLWNASKPQEVL